MAFAAEHEPVDDPEPLVEEETTDVEAVEGRPEDGVIVFSLPDESGDYVDCSEVEWPTEEAAAGFDAEGSSTEGVEPAEVEFSEITQVGECFFVSAEGPNGQWNHGQAVRAYVYALKSGELDGLFEIQVPLGHMVREVARSDIGKETDDGEAPELTDATLERNHPGQGKGKAKGRR